MKLRVWLGLLVLGIMVGSAGLRPSTRFAGIANPKASELPYVQATHGLAPSCDNGHVTEEVHPHCAVCGEPVYIRPVPIDEIPDAWRGKVITASPAPAA